MSHCSALKRAFTLLMAVNVIAFSGCAAPEKQAAGDETTVYGKVTTLSGLDITIALGEESEVSAESQDPALTLTGKTKTFTVTDESVLKSPLKLSDLVQDDILKVIYATSADGLEKLRSVERLDHMTTRSLQAKGSPTVTGAAEYDQSGGNAEESGKLWEAQAENRSGVRVRDKGILVLTDCTINTSGKTSSEDESGFYGLNSGILATGGSSLTMKGGAVSTLGTGAAAAFSFGNGSALNLEGLHLTTSGDASPGFSATYGGTVNATNVKVETKGARSSVIATGYEGGAITADRITGVTSGAYSPSIYSTGIVNITGSNLNANNCEAAIVEGNSSITATDTIFASGASNGVTLCGPFSGSVAEGPSVFVMTSGSLASKEGALFYADGTDAQIRLSNVTLSNTSGVFLNAQSGQVGQKLGRGAKVDLIADTQSLVGNITADSLSVVRISLKNNAALSGAVNADNTAQAVSLTLDKTSIWTVTGTSYVTALTNADETFANIQDNGHLIYYDSSNSANGWLAGKTIDLAGGGKLLPV